MSGSLELLRSRRPERASQAHGLCGPGQYVSRELRRRGSRNCGLEGRCKTDTCEWLADLESAEPQPPGLRVAGGGQPSRLGA